LKTDTLSAQVVIVCRAPERIEDPDLSRAWQRSVQVGGNDPENINHMEDLLSWQKRQ